MCPLLPFAEMPTKLLSTELAEPENLSSYLRQANAMYRLLPLLPSRCACRRYSTTAFANPLQKCMSVMMFSLTVLAGHQGTPAWHVVQLRLSLSALRQASGSESEPEVQDLQAPVGWGGRTRLQQAAWIVALASESTDGIHVQAFFGGNYQAGRLIVAARPLEFDVSPSESESGG